MTKNINGPKPPTVSSISSRDCENLHTAIKVLEEGLPLKPVRLRANTAICVHAGDVVELRGWVHGSEPVPGALNILPRPSTMLPGGIEVVKSELVILSEDKLQVVILVHNRGKRDCTLDSSIVLAELDASVPL